MKKTLFLLCFLASFSILKAQKSYVEFTNYHSTSEVEAIIAKMGGNANANLHMLTMTPEGRIYGVLEIGKEVKSKQKNLPAIFVAANMEGDRPLSTEAALFLAQNLLENAKYYENYTWYILANGNPHASLSYFSKPLYANTGNSTLINDDMDDATDEDGFEDLNKDGFITQMRVKSPEGKYIIDPLSPYVMRKANASKGEIGVYKLYSEGNDNDNDGKYNEDPAGGVNIGKTFPHLFKYFDPKSGLYPGNEAETFVLIEFIMNRPEIAMTFTFGSSNFVLQQPKAGRKAKADLNKIKIPKRWASYINADPDKNYKMAEVMEMVAKVMPPGMEVTESMIASMLGLGAAVNPLSDDLSFYGEINKEYKEYLKKNKAEQKRLKPQGAKNGSFELWSYYQLGVPSFSMDLWAIPEATEEKKETSGITLDKVENMSTEEFIELGNDKISAFLKENNAPEQYSAEKIIELINGGKLTTKMLAGLLKKMAENAPKKDGELSKADKAFISYDKNTTHGKSFVQWEKFNHPQLGEVEIGGIVPYAKTTPAPENIDSILNLKVPYIYQLSDKLAQLKIKDIKLKDLGKGVYQIDVFIHNSGSLPFVTAMGKRNNHPAPATIDISGSNLTFLKGYKHTAIKSIDGLSTKKVSFIIQSAKKQSIEIKLKATQASGEIKKLNL
ncbi:MAG: hypothetical protein KAI79_17180 [Bacteroidales bacterium]|nr:hypothetical protein [Bacteroidales bacterium]